MLFYNLKLSKLSLLLSKIDDTNLLFANERCETKQTIDVSVQHSIFYNIGLREMRFFHCNFKFNTFEDVYFKKATFENVSFLGAKFIDCNFSGATFIKCDFRYAIFVNCTIDFDALKENLPSELNIRRDLCKNLALANISCGNTSQFKKFFYEERKTSRKLYFKIAFSPDTYLRDKYDFLKRIEHAFKYLFDLLNCKFWGYGENLTRLILNILILNIAFFIKFLFNDSSQSIHTIFSPENIKDTTIQTVGYFFNFLSPEKDKLTFSILTYKILGVIFVGFFVACLFRTSNKR